MIGYILHDKPTTGVYCGYCTCRISSSFADAKCYGYQCETCKGYFCDDCNPVRDGTCEDCRNKGGGA